jgi:hypothetical protein
MADGLQNYCRACTKAYHEQHRLKRKRDTDSTDESELSSDLYVMHLSFDACGSQFGVKIGKSANPKDRAEYLTSSLPFEARLTATFPGCGHHESYVHNYLKQYRYKQYGAREWFRLHPLKAAALVVQALAEIGQKDDTSNPRALCSHSAQL